jgi:hypothetical protein
MAQWTSIIILIFVTAASMFAQDTLPNYSGTWLLDANASKMGEMSRVESMTLTVSQDEKSISIQTTVKRPESVDGGLGAGARGGFGRVAGGDSSTSYSLDGKETTVHTDTPAGPMPVKFKAKFDKGTLKLSQSRTFSSPMGEITTLTKEEWRLSSDGKVLTVKREMQTPRGNNSSTLVFNKS